MLAKVSTAATLIVGPVLDSTGAEYTGAVIADLSLSKNGGTLTALAAAATLTHIANGQYTLVLTTGNTDTVGRAQITCNKSTYQMPPVNLDVLPAGSYDVLVTNGTLASTTNITAGTITTVTTVTNQLTAAAIATGVWQDATAGDFTTASSIGKSLYTSGAVPGAANGLFIAGTNAATVVTTSFTTTFTGNLTGSVGSVTGAVGSVTGNVGGNVVGSVASVTAVSAGAITAASFASGAIDSTAIAADAIGASELAATAVAEIAAAILATPANLLATDASGRVTVGSLAAGSITSAVVATDAIDADALAADAVAEIQSGLATSANQTTILARLGSFTGSGVNTVLGFLKALLSKTASTPSDVGGTFDPATDSTEAIRDRGDAAWVTATGFSTHTAADVWAVATRTLTAGTNIVLAKGVGVTGFNDITAAAVATAVWTDTTASDFTTASSPGKILVTQLGGAFTTTSSSIFSTAALANAPGGSAPTAAVVAAAVWDLASSGHTTAGTFGQLLAAAGAASDPLLNQVPGSYASGTAGYNLGRIGSGQILTTSIVAQSGNVTIVRGDDYYNADGRALVFVDAEAGWPTLTSATVVLHTPGGQAIGGSVVTATGAGKTVRFEMTAAQTAAESAGQGAFTVVATLASGHVDTLAAGTMVVKEHL